jgi:hypothetical protein
LPLSPNREVGRPHEFRIARGWTAPAFNV